MEIAKPKLVVFNFDYWCLLHRHASVSVYVYSALLKNIDTCRVSRRQIREETNHCHLVNSRKKVAFMISVYERGLAEAYSRIIVYWGVPQCTMVECWFMNWNDHLLRHGKCQKMWDSRNIFIIIFQLQKLSCSKYFNYYKFACIAVSHNVLWKSYATSTGEISLFLDIRFKLLA